MELKKIIDTEVNNIKNKDFKLSLSGYSTDEIDSYLNNLLLSFSIIKELDNEKDLYINKLIENYKESLNKIKLLEFKIKELENILQLLKKDKNGRN
ncbi:hypothetical protein RNN91_02545 [Mycoplasmopsis felis]|uniref:hypothetical protein n=1 Tax=Mycoplasmopsis felis TaxID=33923 RepID=UPI002AF6A1C4|nr:hypothetical protein [Mycoplasmopsis felis]WQQ01754.1 hypothetical protein RRG54_00055 [Mycoplasmopsis felis]WQQ02196.1 hypothetical protein RNN91_02545 [Mycoplasmopsis felis]WQQ07107.1 hypothetical protein RRG37_00525 [Mycoplasmopsis felis]